MKFERIKDSRLPAEWEEQSFVQLTWPTEESDWRPIFKEVEKCFVNIAKTISKYEEVMIISPDSSLPWNKLSSANCNMKNITTVSIPTNDSWARDHGGITLKTPDGIQILDFKFNGWGLKFPSNYDNQITPNLALQGKFPGIYKNMQQMILEGGAIESDGQGTLITTTECLLSPNRNSWMSKDETEEQLKTIFNLKRILWLHSGFLEGDDTDGHIDTLVRLCSHDTIAYVKCYDQDDDLYYHLDDMENELLEWKQENGDPYRLIPLPLPSPIYYEGRRLPATYANFLIINGAVLVPTYNQKQHDKEALTALSSFFKDRKVIGIDCSTLIKQNGSLHCVTMQYYK